jgi:hypothetical protein
MCLRGPSAHDHDDARRKHDHDSDVLQHDDDHSRRMPALDGPERRVR